MVTTNVDFPVPFTRGFSCFRFRCYCCCLPMGITFVLEEIVSASSTLIFILRNPIINFKPTLSYWSIMLINYTVLLSVKYSSLSVFSFIAISLNHFDNIFFTILTLKSPERIISLRSISACVVNKKS